jgi:hypothetical protein
MGSGSNDAQERAEAEERARRAAIDATVGKINTTFDDPSRQKQYQDYEAANRQFYGDELQRQNQTASRKLKFALSRSGQSGSSVARDVGTRHGEAYNRGVIEADRLAQSMTANLRDQDSQSRLQLIQMASQGLNITQAANQAANMLRTNLQAGYGQQRADALGDLFGGFGDLIRNSREESERRRALEDYNLLYQPAYGR